MPHEHLGFGAQIKIDSPKLDVEVSTPPGEVGSKHKWVPYMAAAQLRSQIHRPAGNAERRASPSVFTGV